jgi:hypothetical protein
MKIISNFKDYYDSVRAYDTDSDFMFRRKTEQVVISVNNTDIDPALLEVFYNAPNGHGLRAVLLCFCGKIYPFWRINTFGSAPNLEYDHIFTTETLINSALYTINGDLNSAKVRFGVDDANRFLETGNTWHSSFNRSTVEKFVKENTGVPMGYDMYHELDAPYFLIAPEYVYGQKYKFFHVLKNPVLKPLDFVRIFDPFLAYQEISMFLGGVMAEKNKMPMVAGDDKVLAQQKGFDEESFRQNSPGQKKTNRAANRARKNKKEPT